MGGPAWTVCQVGRLRGEQMGQETSDTSISTPHLKGGPALLHESGEAAAAGAAAATAATCRSCCRWVWQQAPAPQRCSW